MISTDQSVFVYVIGFDWLIEDQAANKMASFVTPKGFQCLRQFLSFISNPIEVIQFF